MKKKTIKRFGVGIIEIAAIADILNELT